MNTDNIQQLLRTQNETISELLATTRDCVTLCHAIMNQSQADDMRQERLLNGKSGFKRETRIKDPVWKDAAKEMYLTQNQRAADISMMLNVPYSSVHTFLKSIDGYPIKKHRSRIRQANYAHRDMKVS